MLEVAGEHAIEEPLLAVFQQITTTIFDQFCTVPSMSRLLPSLKGLMQFIMNISHIMSGVYESDAPD